MVADAEQMSRKLRREFDAKPEVQSRAYVRTPKTRHVQTVSCLLSYFGND